MVRSKVGGWLNKLLRKAPKGQNGNGFGSGPSAEEEEPGTGAELAPVDGTNRLAGVEAVATPEIEIEGNGNGRGHGDEPGSSRASRIKAEVQVLASKIARRDASAKAIQDGIRDLSTLLGGIEEKLQIQTDQGSHISTRLENLAETLRHLPVQGKRAQASLEGIRDELRKQGETSREVSTHFQNIPRILEAIETGGTIQQTQLELARGLVREVVSQGQKIAAFQKETQQLASSVRDITEQGKMQVDSLKRLERGIRRGFDAANHTQLQVAEENRRRHRRGVVAAVGILGLALAVSAGSAAMSLSLTRTALAETKQALADFEAPAPLGAPIGASTTEVSAAPAPAQPTVGGSLFGLLIDGVFDTVFGTPPAVAASGSGTPAVSPATTSTASLDASLPTTMR